MELTRTQRLLTSLRESIIDKPPYISGTLQLPDPYFSLFYKVAEDGVGVDGHTARHIDLAKATPDELEKLIQACEPASFGKGQENVFDETYRKARKMDSEKFVPVLDPFHTDLIKIIRGYLLEGDQSKKTIKMELYKLNVYGKGSFFRPHVDTPRSEKMFGSLVIVFPTPHTGGALLLRHRGHEWTFDSGQALAAKDQPSIGYVAFFSDIEHEVAPVTSGHRITLTYNLYFDDADGPVFANDAVSEHPTLPQLRNEGAFREAFTALLEDPEFLADGGALAFGLRHVYPIKNNLKHVHSALKGSDAFVYQHVRMLGYEPVIYVYYHHRQDRGVIIDKVADFGDCQEADSMVDILCREGGIYVHRDEWTVNNRTDREGRMPQLMKWATPVTNFNDQEGAYPSFFGNEQEFVWVYGSVCLVIRIGGAGDRLAYPTYHYR